MHDSRKVFLFLTLCLLFGFLISAGCTQKDGASPLVTPGVPLPPGQPNPGAPAGTCPQPQIWCNGRCIDPAIDMGNCGGCMNPCQPGQPCINGKCGSESPGGLVAPACVPGLIHCNGNCMNVADDPDNCGSCGHRCPSGQPCSGGICSSGIPGIPATPGITATSTTSGTPGSPSCTSGQTNCYGTCADLQSDATHCGACNIKCASGKVCSAGSCTISCSAGQNNCGGSCINTQTSSQHCGKCNNPCSSGQTCQNGKCGLYASVMTLDPHEVCINSGKSWCWGVCSDRYTDVNNCGKCGNKCPSGQGCSGGYCGLFWQGSWINEFGGNPMTMVQSGSSVTGKDSGVFSDVSTLSGTTSGNPPVLFGTWDCPATNESGYFTFKMSSDGKKFSVSYNYTNPYDSGGFTSTDMIRQ